MIKTLKFLNGNFNKNNIRAFERGYDNNRYYEYLIKHYVTISAGNIYFYYQILKLTIKSLELS